MRLITILGARPQIIKAAAISRAIRNLDHPHIEDCILHTGQHYDDNMSRQFFTELDITAPYRNLSIGSGPQGQQTARMLSALEEELLQAKPDGVIIYGDTNSTLAGALAASKLQIPVFHIEAGLRSFNMTMPEEQNRIVSDQLSNICFAPTHTAVENLRREGFIDSPTLFDKGRKRQVVMSGDVMYDNTLYFAQLASRQCSILAQIGVKKGAYVLATIHRNYNTDDPRRLLDIFNALIDITSQFDVPVVLPLHPRTKRLLDQEFLPHLDRLRIIPPVSYLEMLELERHARVVMTDSGGVQKEAFFFERPCIIMRPETEWTEILDHGAGLLTDADRQRIVDAYRKLDSTAVHFPPLFGDGHAAEKIIDQIVNYLD